jgi:hypothetical protein
LGWSLDCEAKETVGRSAVPLQSPPLQIAGIKSLAQAPNAPYSLDPTRQERQGPP